MVRTVFHVLSVRAEGADRALRGTFRTGAAEAGHALRFSTPEGTRHSVRVRERRDGRRHVTLVVGGSAEDTAALRQGLYLFDGGTM